MANIIFSRFLHIFLEPKAGITADVVQKEMDQALDWFRYEPKCWVVYSNSDISTWMARLQKYAEPTGRLFICAFDTTEKNGWMAKAFWDWINKPR